MNGCTNTFLAEVHTEQETAAFARRLAVVLFPGAVVVLNGTLGAGKTRLVQALAEALGGDPRCVVSPTFVLIQEYEAALPIYHFDAYRLRDEDEFIQLGPEEYFEGKGICLIEWGERVESCLPRERLEINLEVIGPTDRQIRVLGLGEKYFQAIQLLQDST